MNNAEWVCARDDLVKMLLQLGFPKELGHELARILGSPKAIDRLTAYLRYTCPQKAEMVVDEALAIRSEIDAWREKKSAQEADMVYNELLWAGLEEEQI